MPEIFGVEHLTYIAVSTIVLSAALLYAKKAAKTEKQQQIVLKIFASLLFISIITNRLSQVFRYEEVRWIQIIPDSFCGMTSLVLSLAVLLGKKDNVVYHFVWILALFGGVSTVIYASFVGQAPSIFYLPTISGLLHHSFAALTAVALLLFKQINITYKKWYCTLFGFTAYLTLGAFLIAVGGMDDAFHIFTPLLDGTPLTAWVMAPIYAVCYALILFLIEFFRKCKTKKSS